MRFEKIKYMYKCFLKKHFGMYSLQTINSCPFSCSVNVHTVENSSTLPVTCQNPGAHQLIRGYKSLGDLTEDGFNRLRCLGYRTHIKQNHEYTYILDTKTSAVWTGQ